jgi:hypothetical protein
MRQDATRALRARHSPVGCAAHRLYGRDPRKAEFAAGEVHLHWSLTQRAAISIFDV